MSAVKKTDYLPEAATLDLWRVAENGEVSQLAPVLARVRDINAQNEHGVTALMRAAQYGRVRMVRALLEHGADANIKRNDKFTALALAAFFGHTEIVRVLMEHGADSEASTRGDTSPHMWATARTFNEVVDQLEKPAPPVEKSAPPVAKPAPAPPKTQEPVAAPAIVSAGPVARAVAKTAEVRTLKDPPEIWDLVHEVPRGFNPRSAFVTRLKSIQSGWVFRAATAVIVISAAVAGVMLLRGVQARNEGRLAAAPATAPAAQPVAAKNLRTDTPASVNNSQPAILDPSTATPSTVAPVEGDVTTTTSPVVNRKPRWPRAGALHAGREAAREVPPAETVQPVPTPAAQPVPAQRSDAQSKVSAPPPLSPQLIAPAKRATPKGKVIQWP